jgi:hypothetical protein
MDTTPNTNAITREDFLALTAQIEALRDCVLTLAAVTLMPSRDGKLNASMKDARHILSRINEPLSTYEVPI